MCLCNTTQTHFIREFTDLTISEWRFTEKIQKVIVLNFHKVILHITFEKNNSLSYLVTLKVIYRIRQNSRGGKLSRFLLNRESFPVEYFTRLGIHYY